MMQSPQIYLIRIQGRLSDRWHDWFGGMTVTNCENGEVLLQGSVEDQSGLVGIINQIHNLNLRLISVNRLGSSETRKIQEEEKNS